MRIHTPVSLLASAFFLLVAAHAAEENAIVTESRVNVRAQPSLVGEVITQLQTGEKVTVLERIPVETPKAGEPTNWAKIKLPQNTPVWVFAPFVKDGVVSVSRLNVRAGRGENYSVIGRVNRGETLKPIRTLDEWMEIETPTNAYAFVDSDLLRFENETNTIAATRATTPVAEIPVQAPTTNKTETVAGTIPNRVLEAEPPTVATQDVPLAEPLQPEVKPEPAKPEAELPPSTISPPAATAATTPATPEALPKVAPPIVKRNEPLPKRVVRREGVIRATTSIQAPTWYELVHAETKKRINYLFDENLEVNLKDYRGQKVVVTGEEAIDPRWPNTPILDMQTLDVLP